MDLDRFRNTVRFYVDMAMGKPVSIYRFLYERTPTKIVFPNSNHGILSTITLRWDHWHWETYSGSKSILWFSRMSEGYRGRNKHVPELENFTEQRTLPSWTCDIQEIEGLAASQSELNLFATLNDFAIARTPKWISDISEENLFQNLSHREIRILQPGGGGDSFARYLWDGGRTFLINAGGSHHFAAARYIASRLNMPVRLSGRLDLYGIRSAAAEQLMQKYDLYALPNTCNHFFYAAMESFSASYGECPLPFPLHEDASLILLPQNESRSMKVSRALRDAGIFVVSNYLRGHAYVHPAWSIKHEAI